MKLYGICLHAHCACVDCGMEFRNVTRYLVPSAISSSISWIRLGIL